MAVCPMGPDFRRSAIILMPDKSLDKFQHLLCYQFPGKVCKTFIRGFDFPRASNNLQNTPRKAGSFRVQDYSREFTTDHPESCIITLIHAAKPGDFK
jgi:hypothetical protein